MLFVDKNGEARSTSRLIISNDSVDPWDAKFVSLQKADSSSSRK